MQLRYAVFGKSGEVLLVYCSIDNCIYLNILCVGFWRSSVNVMNSTLQWNSPHEESTLDIY